MSASGLLSLLVVWLAAIISPGPDLVQIIRVGSRSRAAGIWCALGIMAGNTLWITGSLLGLSALVTRYPQVLTALQLLGGSYLLWMGIGAVRGGLAARVSTATVPRQAASGITSDGPVPDLPPARAFRLGVTTNLANPKAILFFGAVFAQFIRPDMSGGWAVLIAVVLILTGIAWFAGFALAVRAMAARIVRNSAVIDIVTGVIFIALAVFMLWEGVGGLIRAVQ